MNSAKRRKLFTLVNGKIVRTNIDGEGLQAISNTQEYDNNQRDHICETTSGNNQADHQEEDRAEEQSQAFDDHDPLGLGFALD